MLEVLAVALGAVGSVDQHHRLRRCLIRDIHDIVALALQLQLITALEGLEV